MRVRITAISENVARMRRELTRMDCSTSDSRARGILCGAELTDAIVR